MKENKIETVDLAETTFPGQRICPAEGVEKTELLKWTSEAGPRQTADVQKAFSKVLRAGSGTLVLSSRPDGTEYMSVQCTLGCPTAEEQQHKNKQTAVLNLMHVEHGGTITRDNCRALVVQALALIATLVDCRPVRDERKSVEQHAKEAADREAVQVARDAENVKRQAEKQTAAEKIEKEYPYLNRVNGGGQRGGKEAAKNIRLILKKEFPGIRFSVISSYSSVRIGWDNGPTVNQVDSHVQKFQEGHFDGMTDSYDYNSTAFNDTFGGVKYVFTTRNTGDLIETVKGALEIPGNLEGWEADQYLNHKARELVSATDLTGKGAFVEVYDAADIGQGCHVIKYALRFETTSIVPATDKDRQAHHAPHSCTIEEHTHTKKGFQMWIVIMSDRIEHDEFNALKSTAQALGGWYSRAWGESPAGFAFKAQTAAQTFADSVGGGKPTPDGTKPDKRLESFRGVCLGLVEDALVRKVVLNFRAMADRLTSQIEDKTRDMTQNPTPKRNLEYRARMIDGHHLERVQTAARLLADGLEADTLPLILQTVRTKKDLMAYTQTGVSCPSYYEIVDSGEFSDTSPAAVALQTLLTSASDPEVEAERKKETDLKNKILDFTGQKIPGFFPTPDAVAARMLEALDIQEGETVLEPSAGIGNLAELARDAGGVVTCVEIRPSLCEILELKGFETVQRDFVDPEEQGDLQRFDCVIMNPPFEKGQDADHIRAAFGCLSEGGRLAAIAGEGIFFRSDTKARSFRVWLEEVGGISEQLPDGSFKGTGEVSQTGTATRLVIINK